MIQAPTPEDYKLASDAKQRRDMDENAQPTNLELAAINRILVQEARERLAKDGVSGAVERKTGLGICH